MLTVMFPASATKYLFTTICVLIILIFSPVECYSCSSCSLTSCTSQPLGTCEATHGCTNLKNVLYDKGQVEVAIKKDCHTGSCTPLTFSASLGDGKSFAYNQQCCQSEQCNKQDAEVPEKSSEPNGVECPSCYVENSDSCSNTVTLTCTGEETKCVTVTGTSNVPTPGRADFSFYGMGCATENACNLKDISILERIKATTQCQSNGSSALMPFTLSVLSGIFTLKVLL